MSQSLVEAPDLVPLLRRHQDMLVRAWGKKALNLYRDVSLEEMQAWAANGVNLIVNALESGPDPFLIKRFCEMPVSQEVSGESLSNVIAALLLFKEVALELIQHEYQGNATDAFEAIRQVDSCLLEISGRMGDNFVDDLKESNNREIRKRLAESESLARTTTALLEKLTLDEVLEIVCAEACRLTGATGSSVLLIEDEGWLKVGVSTGDLIPTMNRIPMNDSLAGLAVQRGEPMLFNGPETQMQVYERNPDLHSLLVVPLRGKESFIGALDLINRPEGFSQDSIRILELFAAQAAIAIENARLHHQAEELAVTKERHRLARELHDSVTQALYTASLYTDATNLALTSGKEELAQEHLSELRNMVREAMLDMRLLIFELHPPLLVEAGLVAAIQARLESVEARAGVKTSFQVIGEHILLPSLETEIYRIAQEALTNVVKHARAQDVSLRLLFEENRICLEVQDNGLGFDPAQIEKSGGVGLRSIEERVKQIGGEMIIESAQGQGTTLRVVLDI